MTQAVCRRAFTLVELVVVMAGIAVIALIGLPALTQYPAKSGTIGCVNYLKQIGLAFRIFSTDHEDRYPMQVYTNAMPLPPPASRLAFFFGVMSNELSTPGVLVCPHDTRVSASNWSTLTSSNISYFMGTEAHYTQPRAWLAGDRNLTTNRVAVGPGLLRLATNMRMGWTTEMHNRHGNVVLGDGSVWQTTPRQLQSMLADQVAATNELLVP